MANARFILDNVLHGKSVTPTAGRVITNSNPDDIYTVGNTNVVIAANANLRAVVIHRTTRSGGWTATIQMAGTNLTLTGANGTDTLVGVLNANSDVTNITISGLRGQRIDMILGGRLWQPEVNFTLGGSIGLNINNQFQSGHSGVLYANHTPFQRSASANWKHLTFSEASDFYNGVTAAIRKESVIFVDLYPSESQQERSRFIGWIGGVTGPNRAPRGEMAAEILALEATPLAVTAAPTTTPTTTFDTDSIFIRGSTPPTRPTGGTSTENHLPTGWSRTNPGATTNDNVYRVQRTRTYTSGSFVSATAWGNVVKITDAIGVVDQTPPAFVSAEMSADGHYLTATYNEALDPDHIPALTAFDVLADSGRKGGATHPNPTGTSSFRIDGATMEHYYSTAIPNTAVVTIEYTNPGDATALQDTSGNEVASYGPDSVTQPNQLPVAAAPSVSIDAIPDGDEGVAVRLSSSIGNDGTYDGDVTYAWTVGGGTLNDATLEEPTWTRPAVAANTDYDVDLEITVNGTGTNAQNGTSDTATATTVQATVQNVTILLAPGAPTGLAESATDQDSITWGWMAPTTGGAVASYEYRVALSGATFIGAWTTVGTDTSVTITGLSASGNYKIEVRSRNATDVSASVEDTASTTAATATTDYEIAIDRNTYLGLASIVGWFSIGSWPGAITNSGTPVSVTSLTISAGDTDRLLMACNRLSAATERRGVLSYTGTNVDGTTITFSVNMSGATFSGGYSFTLPDESLWTALRATPSNEIGGTLTMTV